MTGLSKTDEADIFSGCGNGTLDIAVVRASSTWGKEPVIAILECALIMGTGNLYFEVCFIAQRENPMCKAKM